MPYKTQNERTEKNSNIRFNKIKHKITQTKITENSAKIITHTQIKKKRNKQIKCQINTKRQDNVRINFIK